MHACQRFHPRVETLEDRCTPAGTVTGSFFQGTWTLRGDADANDITINPTATPGQFELIGNGTTLPATLTQSGVKNIVIKLFAGDDVVTFNSTAMQAKLSGNLTVIGGKGANDVFINNAFVSKNVTVLNGTNAAGDDDFQMADSSVKGKVFLSNGDGDAEAYFHRTVPGSSSIGGLTILNGIGSDGLTFTDTSVAGSIVVKNGLPNAANGAGYFEIYNSVNTTGRSFIRGNVTVDFKSGNVAFLDLTDVEVRGNVSLRHGSGMSEIKFDGFAVAQPTLIHGNLTITDAGPLEMRVGKESKKTGLVVGKKLTISTGGGADTLTLHQLRVNGPTLIKTGGGIDTVTIDDSHFLGPQPTVFLPFAFRLLTGAGADIVNIETTAATAFTTQFGSTALVSMGGGADTLTLGFAADATRQVELFNKAKFDGGLDNDTLNQLNAVSIFDLPIQVVFEP